MIAATLLALTLARPPLPLVDSGVDHGSRAGLVESAPNDDVAVCHGDDADDEDE